MIFDSPFILAIMPTIPEYCENSIQDKIFNAPFNTISSLLGVLVGIAIYILAKQLNKLNNISLSLSIIVFSMGIGSAIFHEFPNKITYWLDVIPLALFQIIFIITYPAKVLKWNKISISVLIILFLVTTGLLSIHENILSGSLTYVPALAVLAIFGFLHYFNDLEQRTILIAASILFLIAIFFRAVDMKVCDIIPFGTHFLWHILIVVILYLSAKGLIFNLPSEGDNISASL